MIEKIVVASIFICWSLAKLLANVSVSKRLAHLRGINIETLIFWLSFTVLTLNNT